MTPAAFHAALVAAVNARGQTAQAATPGPWDRAADSELATDNDYLPNAIGNWSGEYARCVTMSGTGVGDQADADAAHIAANGPDRILRDVARDLDVLKRHAPKPLGFVPVTSCATCVERGGGITMPADWPCPEIRGLAAAYQITAEET